MLRKKVEHFSLDYSQLNVADTLYTVYQNSYINETVLNF